MPLPLTVSCFSKIQTGFTFLVPAHLDSPGKRAVKRVCVCVLVCGLSGTISTNMNHSLINFGTCKLCMGWSLGYIMWWFWERHYILINHLILCGSVQRHSILCGSLWQDATSRYSTHTTELIIISYPEKARRHVTTASLFILWCNHNNLLKVACSGLGWLKVETVTYEAVD